jgi:hypothetical protein
MQSTSPKRGQEDAVPNTFITPSIIARTGLANLYNSLVLGGLVWRDFDSDFAGQVGDTITIRKPAIFTAEEFNREAGITLQDAKEDKVSVVLDTIANVSFPVTDEQMTLDIVDFQLQLLEPAMMAIAQKIDGDLALNLVEAAISKGQVASVDHSDDAIWGTSANTVFRGARTVLSRNKLPTQNRVAVLSPEAISESLGDKLLVTSNESGSTDALREANIGRLLGIDTYESQVFGGGPGETGEADGIAFHQTAVTLATRPLDKPRGLAPNQVEVASFKGLSLRVVYAYNNDLKQDEVSIDMLYGVATTRAQAAVELDFGQGS